jgi:hypothetical protein
VTESETVTREIVLGAGFRPGRAPLSVLRLSWSAEDPLAVVLVVAAKPEHPSLLRGRWVVLRDRFREALAGAGREAGAASMTREVAGGHVQVSATGTHVTLTLRAVPLPCVVTVPAEPVRSFLAETDAIVPPGLERCQPALEAELSRMLDRG